MSSLGDIDPLTGTSALPDLGEACSRYFRYRDLIEVGETWQRLRLDNVPRQADTFTAIARLARDILDPLSDEFGRPTITYGFASLALVRHIGGRIDPARDQHAGHELKASGRPVCPRLGQAADVIFDDMPSIRIAAWIAEYLPFDRIYYYGPNRPLHLSIGPMETRTVVTMLPGASGRRIPCIRSIKWLRSEGAKT